MGEGVKCIQGTAVERRREKRAIHARRGGAQQHTADGEESLDDLETRVDRQCRCRGTRLLSCGECVGIEERWHVSGGRAVLMWGSRERVGGSVVDPRHMSNVLREFGDEGQMLLLSGRPGSRNS